MSDKTASEGIDEIIKLYGGWKGETISQIRAAVKEAYPDIVEEVKWRMKSRPEGLPVLTYKGIVCLTETFKNDLKLVFFKGVDMKDPKKLFNARLNSSQVRAIQFIEGDKIDKDGIKQLVLEAIDLNKAKN